MNELKITFEYKYINGVNSKCLSKHRHINRIFPYCVAVSVEKGVFFVEINHKRYEVFEGETIFIPSFVPHNVGVDSDGVATHAHFVCSYLNVDIFNFSKINSLIVKNSDICKLLTKMNHSAAIGGVEGKLGIDNAISGIICILFHERLLTPECLSKDLWLCKVLNYINENAHQAITVDEIISLSGYAKTNLYQLFKKTINLTPHQYIEQERLKKAIFSMLEGKNIKESAKSAGYDDEIYFTKKFKKIFGMTPSEYRKNVKNQWGKT